PRAWYVRLWNYAQGTPTDARVTLDFAALDGGFALPGEADPVWAGDVDRMFVSLVAPGYDEQVGGALPMPVEGWAELSAIACTGSGAVLAI
ncbi:TIGR02217 family protein, partial [Bacillus amyloliquefaciens]|nr:TIGR02217 family protein [Bacillus amyloliquefaciens]